MWVARVIPREQEIYSKIFAGTTNFVTLLDEWLAKLQREQMTATEMCAARSPWKNSENVQNMRLA